MLGRRYPYPRAGSLAAPIFAVAGLVIGWLAAARYQSVPPPPANALLWAFVAGFASYLIFSSQGPSRPPVLWQAAVADGVVGGIVAGAVSTFIDALAASGAGAGGSLSFGTVIGALIAAGLAGGVIGAGLGYLVLLIGGPGRLERGPGGGKQKSRSGQAGRRRNRKR